MLALALGTAWLTGFLLLRTLWPWTWPSASQLALQSFLAVTFGSGLTACHLFLWLSFKFAPGAFIWSETAVIAALGTVLLLRRARAGRPELSVAVPARASRLQWLVAAAFVTALMCAAVVFFLLSAREPDGRYDAVAMWNVKARMIYMSGGDWVRAVSSYLPHPDYPLLLPLSIARGWFYMGSAAHTLPAVMAALFTCAIVGMLSSSLAVLRSGTQGMLAAITLLAPVVFLYFGASQYADMPLALFALSTLVLLTLHEHAPPGNRSLLFLAGLSAGFAAWTKNEGLLFVLVVVAARAAVRIKADGVRPWLREALYFVAGLLPLLLILGYFKAHAAANDIMAAQQHLSSVLSKIGNVSRYELILKALWQQLVFFGGWQPNPMYLLALYPLVTGLSLANRQGRGVATTAGTLAALFAGYFVVYLLTPRDLEWHLYTSLDRLLLQLWPGAVFLYFLVVRTPEEASAQG